MERVTARLGGPAHTDNEIDGIVAAPPPGG